MTSSPHLQINTNLLPFPHTPSAIFPKIMLHPSSTDGHKKEWIMTQKNNNITFGKIFNKSQSSRCTYQHWIIDAPSTQDLIPCDGCHLTPPSQLQHQPSDRKTCTLLIPTRHAKVIQVSTNTDQQLLQESQKIITPLPDIINGNLHDYTWFPALKHSLLSIQMDSIDGSLITKWISNNSLRTDLSYYLNMMQNMPTRTFHIYTDGSLDLSENHITGHSVMEAGWILKDNELSFGCGILNFPSST
jgi:hypothetical protein